MSKNVGLKCLETAIANINLVHEDVKRRVSFIKSCKCSPKKRVITFALQNAEYQYT